MGNAESTPAKAADKAGLDSTDSTAATAKMTKNDEQPLPLPPTEEYHADFVALGLGGTNMMCMLWSLAMGRSCIGVEKRGDPFLSIHWNIRVDLYHQLGKIDDMMMKRYGKQGIPRRANGKLFRLAECFYTPKTSAGFVVPDEVINGFDTEHHIAGTIQHIEFMDDRHIDGKPHRTIHVLPPPRIPHKPDPKAIRTNIRQVLDGPSTFQCEANNLLILLRRYLEAVQAHDQQRGVAPRVRLFTTHQVKQDGFIRKSNKDDDKVSILIEHVTELDYKGTLTRVPTPGQGGGILIHAPELCVIAQGVHSVDAEQLGFGKTDVIVDHGNGQGPHVAQADYLAGFIDVLVHGRIRRRIASAFDKNGDEYWVRQIAVGHENDPQVGWLLVQVPDFADFDPITAGLVPEGTDHDSKEYFAAYERLLYDYYIQEVSKILEIDETTLRTVKMAYGPKLFSLVEQMGDNPHIAPNVMVAGDSFGNGHFLTSGGAMTGMIGHSMGVLKFWETLEETDKKKPMDSKEKKEQAYKLMSDIIVRATKDWLEQSALEFSSFTPVNFGAERIQALSKTSKIDVNARSKSIEASIRKRHELQVQDPCCWRRPALRNGRVYTAGLKPLKPSSTH